MSYFGDNTPHQELLEYVEYLQERFELDQEETAILMIKVTSAIIDPCDVIHEEIRYRKEKEL